MYFKVLSDAIPERKESLTEEHHSIATEENGVANWSGDVGEIKYTFLLDLNLTPSLGCYFTSKLVLHSLLKTISSIPCGNSYSRRRSLGNGDSPRI